MLRERVTRLVFVFWLCSLGGALVAYSDRAVGAYTLSVVWARVAGYHALIALGASLCISPLQRVRGWLDRSFKGRRRLAASGASEEHPASGDAPAHPVGRNSGGGARLRRALGLASTASASLHSVLGMYSSPLQLAEQVEDAHLRFGFGALLVLLLLALTSFPRLVQRLRLRSWKELHRLAYVAFPLALLHGLLGPYASTRALIGIGVVVAGVGLLRLWPAYGRAG